MAVFADRGGVVILIPKTANNNFFLLFSYFKKRNTCSFVRICFWRMYIRVYKSNILGIIFAK